MVMKIITMHRSYLYPHNPIFCALSILKGRVFFASYAKNSENQGIKTKPRVALGFGVYLRRREPFLRSVACRTSA